MWTDQLIHTHSKTSTDSHSVDSPPEIKTDSIYSLFNSCFWSYCDRFNSACYAEENNGIKSAPT